MEKNTILLKLICPAIIVLLLNMPSYKSANYQSLSWFKIKSWFKIIDTFVLFSKDACLPCRHKRGVLGGGFTAGRNIWPDYTQKDRKTLGTQHQAGSACSVCLRVGQIKGTWWNRRIWKREGWVQEKAERKMKTEMKEWKSRDMKRGWGWKTEGSEWDESSIDSQVSEGELTRGQKEGEWGGEKGTEEVNNGTQSVWERENGEGQKYRQVKTPREEKFLRGAFGLKVKWWHI